MPFPLIGAIASRVVPKVVSAIKNKINKKKKQIPAALRDAIKRNMPSVSISTPSQRPPAPTPSGIGIGTAMLAVGILVVVVFAVKR